MTSRPRNFPILMLLLIGSVSIFSCSYSARSSRRLLSAAAQTNYDVIIVPGVPYDKGHWSRTMKGRIYWSKYLYDRGIARNIIYSGSAVYTPYCEGEIMALYAAAIGVPGQHIFTETQAEHSTENLYYSYRLARRLGFTTIALASDPFQTKMLRRFARRKVARNIAMIPMVIDTMRSLNPSMTNPRVNVTTAFRASFIPLIQREGKWKRLMGTLGKNIDTARSLNP